MGTLEIVLIIIGALLVLASFFIPAGSSEPVDGDKLRKEIKNTLETEIKNMKSQVDSVVNESIEYACDKTERKLERLSNEKIMAVSEFSDTVLKKINDNHNEVMFLYDMLNDKQKSLKETVLEADALEKKIAAKNEENKAVVEPSPEPAVEEKAVKKAMFTQLSPNSMEKESKYKNQVVFSEEPKNSPSDNPEVSETDEVIRNFEPPVIKKSLTSGLSDKLGKKSSEKEKSKSQVLKLAGEGKTDVEIAKELGMGVGEVSLILNLHAEELR